ncbi:MAG: RDD family protein [Desulfobacteraceae bacterium]|nr:RDD family protein [Desulfobacteraceae bacterium]
MTGNGLHATRLDEITIQTPEGVSFSLPLAGPISRFLAWLLDVCCLMAAAQMVRLISLLFGIISPDASNAVSIFIFFILNIAYTIVLEWYWQGQTIGKRIFGLRVMDAGGLQLQPSQVIIRNLLRPVDSLPAFYFLGGVACLTTRYSQRLGDMAANTIVIALPKIKKPEIDLIIKPNYYNSLLNYPHLAARLRQKTTPEEANFALQSLLRRDDFVPEARLHLFHTFAGHYKRKVRFPDDILAGISDEQYIRNVVDLLFKG